MYFSKLKNGKSGGAHKILKELIKSTIDLMMPVYIKVFNKVWSIGEVPEDWLVGLKYQYSNKGVVKLTVIIIEESHLYLV